jgi:TonB family protein
VALEQTIRFVFAAVGVCALASSGAAAADAAKSFEVRQIALTSPNGTPYPLVARTINLPGKATLSCTAGADGAIHDCKVASEDPANWGFGEAALALVPAINVGAGADGRSVQVPVGFQLDPEDVGPDPDLKTPGFAIADAQIKWVERPQLQDFVVSYPAEAVKRDVEGFVALACRVTPDGRLSPCAVMSEEPRNLGFDKAALSLAAKFRMATRTLDGRPVVNGVVRQGLSWSLH